MLSLIMCQAMRLSVSVKAQPSPKYPDVVIPRLEISQILTRLGNCAPRAINSNRFRLRNFS